MSAKPTTERERNLARWAELEPERCQWTCGFTDGVQAYRLLLRRDYRHVIASITTEPDNSILLGALIEAVTARGWTYSLRSFLVTNGTSTEANIWNPSVFASSGKGEADTAADALLAAYVSAIEADK